MISITINSFSSQKIDSVEIKLRIKHIQDSTKNQLIFGGQYEKLQKLESDLIKIDTNLRNLKAQNANVKYLKKEILQYRKKLRLFELRIRDTNILAKKTAPLIERIYRKERQLKKIDSLPFLINVAYNQLESKLREFISVENSNLYFPNIKEIGVLTSSDSIVRAYSWKLNVKSNKYLYKSIIQVQSDNGVIFYDLKDSVVADISQEDIYTDQDWKGALYYDIVKNDFKENSYLLLSWRPTTDYLIQNKYVESFKVEDGRLKFGVPVIKKENKILSRLVFTYSAAVSMAIKYEANHNLITFDHLNTEAEEVQGKYQYYGPDFSYDALKLTDQYWVFIEDFNLDSIITQPKDELPF